MPRKSKKMEEITEIKEEKSKSTKKRKVKEVAPEEQKTEFNIGEILSWSDEECLEKDKFLSFKVSDVKNILKSLVSTSEQLKDTTAKLNLLKDTISKGKMLGYEVMCPHCKRKYIVSSTELNREGTVICKVCGTEYRENENINGISYVQELAEDENKVTNV